MFWNRRSIPLNEEYKLIKSVERARQGWSEIDTWHILESSTYDDQLPKLLAEVRYRFLLNQARKREAYNRWYYEAVASE